MSNCRSGCLSQDHRSWGECVRSAQIQLGDIRGRNTNQAWDYELDAYESAVRQGIEPRTTQLADTRAAVEFANQTGIGNPWQG